MTLAFPSRSCGALCERSPPTRPRPRHWQRPRFRARRLLPSLGSRCGSSLRKVGRRAAIARQLAGETVSVERAAVVKALGEEGEGLVAALEALPRGLDPDGCPAAFKRLDLSFRKLAPPGYPFERLAVGNADYVATVPLNDQNDGVEGGTPAAICNGGVLTPPERVVGEALVRSGDVCAGARRVVAGAALDLVITFHYRRGL